MLILIETGSIAMRPRRFSNEKWAATNKERSPKCEHGLWENELETNKNQNNMNRRAWYIVIIIALLCIVALFSSPLSPLRPKSSPVAWVTGVPPSISVTSRPQTSPFKPEGDRNIPSGISLRTNASSDIAQQFAATNALLEKAEAEAYKKDPLLHRYELYRDVPSKWLSSNCGSQINALIKYSSIKDSNLVRERQNTFKELFPLFSLSVVKELSADKGFEELLLTAHQLAQQASLPPPYTMADARIGFTPPAPVQNGVPSYEMLRNEFEVRYPLWINEINRIINEKHVPPDVVEGIRAKAIDHTLTGAVDMYLAVRTPPELRALRKQHRDLEITLINRRNFPSQ